MNGDISQDDEVRMLMSNLRAIGVAPIVDELEVLLNQWLQTGEDTASAMYRDIERIVRRENQ